MKEEKNEGKKDQKVRRKTRRRRRRRRRLGRRRRRKICSVSSTSQILKNLDKMNINLKYLCILHQKQFFCSLKLPNVTSSLWSHQLIFFANFVRTFDLSSTVFSHYQSSTVKKWLFHFKSWQLFTNQTVINQSVICSISLFSLLQECFCHFKGWQLLGWQLLSCQSVINWSVPLTRLTITWKYSPHDWWEPLFFVLMAHWDMVGNYAHDWFLLRD